MRASSLAVPSAACHLTVTALSATSHRSLGTRNANSMKGRTYATGYGSVDRARSGRRVRSQSVKFGLYLCGIGVFHAGEDLQRPHPNAAGVLLVTGRLVGVAEVRQDD